MNYKLILGVSTGLILIVVGILFVALKGKEIAGKKTKHGSLIQISIYKHT